MAWGSFSNVRDNPKSATLQMKLESTKIFLAARSRCTNCISHKYFIPFAIPCNILTSWWIDKFPWLLCWIEQQIIYAVYGTSNQGLPNQIKTSVCLRGCCRKPRHRTNLSFQTKSGWFGSDTIVLILSSNRKHTRDSNTNSTMGKLMCRG